MSTEACSPWGTAASWNSSAGSWEQTGCCSSPGTGAVLLRVYQRLYPAEGERAVYARWSRLAAAKITADRFRGEYFRRFLTHKAGQGFSLRQVLESMELAPLLPGLCGALGVGPGTELTHKNAPLIKSYLGRALGPGAGLL